MPPPDADLYPTATGLAKATVDKHSSKESLVLYAGWFCPFGLQSVSLIFQRTWTVLEEKGIPYQYVEVRTHAATGLSRKLKRMSNNANQVNPYHKPESLMKLNPRGLVPTLQYDNKPLYESTVIAEFLEDAYPDHGSKLLPSDPYKRAISRIWTDYVSTRVIPSFQRFLQFQSDGSNSSIVQVRDEFLSTLKEFTKAMDKDGPYFEGENPALVDFVMAPFALRLWVFDHFKGGSGVPLEGQGGDSEATWSRWRKWLSAMESRKSIKETTSDREHYLPIYQR
ncbi:hypothetical protein MMC11_006420 [Xylographa trunciseda]|nr:hypothetical protein [Xylographa trunciseda]